MAINDLPTPTDSKQGLRSYREAASYLVLNEQRRSRGEEEPRCPLEPRLPKVSNHPSPAACASPQRFRTECPKVALSRCRPRTPSPPHPSPPSRESSKAPRSVSPGGTPATTARAALRRKGFSSCPQVTAPRLRVSWADAIIASVRTRPRTLRKDVAALFYSRADEKRFRREAAVEDEWCEALEEDSLTSLSDDEQEPDELSEQLAVPHQGLWSPQRERRDYAISKAVVVFGDSTRTYGAATGGCAVEASLETDTALSSFLFDDAAFWNGQLTWS
mmetsp:Transcript_22085/g.47406  ORF Transcript_22085/g.47406 Transcript_22085/m.47406 type:complete len:275 (-) Transcript_22085:297-1121(-)|eukprot:CAMPEP_0172551670 /NCGR_PEP_ID=MMETSP1067-20121228/40135_1 /TAXON_ID=265564 ORGANISM="Thalassiosira punctigera, Strain Tpunct2005C2" /NCGR_SAMPLE_ID=MMETSP1067 /ASSEMBLY_ACC=CAM_ASM_000444 /LENGTH=274 /DNA_ID=CAMNT_0013339479 /DNA_START=65 /DNA_END=889 /DNA_ORIENTATION=-